MTNKIKKTWKAVKRKVAGFFGTKRISLLGKIASFAVIEAKIGNLAVSDAKIANSDLRELFSGRTRDAVQLPLFGGHYDE